MTAVQDWLSNRPIDPRGLATLICDVIRRPAAEEQPPPAQPILLRPGLERC
ncbi:hypothetical protein [Mycobacterium sp. IDR2000157661]|uniref:hypothetical protein n=1 Tax=Mycobacterium sp. IDR2000157661 TaxID=2867005 RepID=UPI001EEC1F62|nr:hypothetical protein [Mycobacterium sp. IDR2000157661]ULE32752.1 hypothetical protein K3G64_22135 [Mycobacterium sp. IDR2000157661]